MSPKDIGKLYSTKNEVLKEALTYLFLQFKDKNKFSQTTKTNLQKQDKEKDMNDIRRKFIMGLKLNEQNRIIKGLLYLVSKG